MGWVWNLMFALGERAYGYSVLDEKGVRKKRDEPVERIGKRMAIRLDSKSQRKHLLECYHRRWVSSEHV